MNSHVKCIPNVDDTYMSCMCVHTHVANKNKKNYILSQIVHIQHVCTLYVCMYIPSICYILLPSTEGKFFNKYAILYPVWCILFIFKFYMFFGASY